ncbi:cytochrome P450 [Serendipita vermifera]|nr:cytochrome P450 [Serendipita vermifera]
MESPAKACGVSLTVITLSYFAIRGLPSNLFKKSHSRSYPPGPPREFLIGAMRSFPKDRFLDTFCDWARTYGGIVYAPLPGMDIVILNSHEIAEDLLTKRSSSTGARRPGYLLSDLMGWGWDLAYLQPGHHFSTQRKMLRRSLGPQQVSGHDPRVESEVVKLMTKLNTFQGHPGDTILNFIGEMLTKATYGEQIWREMGNDLSHWNKDAMAVLTEASFAFFPVNVFNFLRFIPDWVPGLRFKYLIKEGNDLARKIRYKPYNKGVELYKAGTLGHCILSDLLDEFGENEDIQDVLATLYAAEIVQFFHALFLFPEVQERVFKEIESLTHGHRLPNFGDRPNLPYTEAVFKESIRWRPVLPIVIRGYFIPKGTVIHQNNQMMLTDPNVWGDPDVFRPERWLEPNASHLPNPFLTLFGWGLRICPGMHLAERVIFHLVATTVSLYKIVPLEGKKIPDPNSIEYTPTGIQHPVGFECRFVLRDEKARHLLRSISL